ncbi:MAG: hypothetical protein RLZZ246_1057 [Planctomycetota bacterium]
MRTALAASIVMALGAARALEPTPAALLAADAKAFLDALEPAQRAEATAAIDAPSRTAWSFVPGDRPGLRLDALTPDRRERALAMMRRALSEHGWKVVRGVFALEGMLGAGQPDRYNPLWYDVLVFGDPVTPPWGMRLEGHHLSLQVMSDGEQVTVTPMFIGAAPFTVKGGELDGFSPLGRERDLAFVLWGMLTPEQRVKARLGAEAPADVVGVPGGEARLRDRAGLEAMHMTREQRDVLWSLVRAFAARLAPTFEKAEVARWRTASVDAMVFAWMGGDAPTDRHYFRVVGDGFAVEFDCTTGVDHVHAAWHDLTRNFGDPFLKHAKDHAAGTAHTHP